MTLCVESFVATTPIVTDVAPPAVTSELTETRTGKGDALASGKDVAIVTGASEPP